MLDGSKKKKNEIQQKKTLSNQDDKNFDEGKMRKEHFERRTKRTSVMNTNAISKLSSPMWNNYKIDSPYTVQ